jgi:hypothetical protein
LSLIIRPSARSSACRREAAEVLQRHVAGEAGNSWFGEREAAAGQAAHHAVVDRLPQGRVVVRVEVQQDGA